MKLNYQIHFCYFALQPIDKLVQLQHMHAKHEELVENVDEEHMEFQFFKVEYLIIKVWRQFIVI